MIRGSQERLTSAAMVNEHQVRATTSSLELSVLCKISVIHIERATDVVTHVVVTKKDQMEVPIPATDK